MKVFVILLPLPINKIGQVPCIESTNTVILDYLYEEHISAEDFLSAELKALNSH